MEKLTNKEEEVMHSLWKLERAFVKEVVASLPEGNHYNTVSTIIRNLEDKGYVAHQAFGKTHQYFPTVSLQSYRKAFMETTSQKYFGSSYKNMVSFFAKEEKISASELREILAIIEKNRAMEFLILIAKSVGILTLFYVVYLTVLKKNTLFTANRCYFIGGIIAALGIPFLEFTRVIEIIIPSQPIFEPLPSFEIPNLQPVASIVQDNPFTIDWWQVAIIVYSVGLLTMIVRFLIQLLSLQRLINSGTKTKKGKYTFVSINKIASPFSFFSHIVYNPKLHTTDELEMILAHEKIHAGQWHSIDMLLTQVALAIQWCNPIAWLYKRSIEQNLEFIADYQAVKQIHNPQQYQRTLVKVSSPTYQPALTNQFYQSFIKKRIVMLNTPQSRKQNLWKLGLILPLLSLFMYSFNVKEVIEYVEEENLAFAKAGAYHQLDSLNTGRDVFLINKKSTSKELNRLELYVSQHWKYVEIKFAERSYTNGDLTSFMFQTKFEKDNEFTNRFSYNDSTKKNWAGYNLMVNTPKEIIIMEQSDGSLMKITPENLVMSDSTFNLQTKNINLKKIEKDRLAKSPVIVIDDQIVFNKKQNLSYTADSITSLSPIKATAMYGLAASSGALILHNSRPRPLNKSYVTIEKNSIMQDTYSFKITKDTQPEELDILTKSLKEKHGALLKVSDVDYNPKGEITSIRLDFKDANGNNKNYTVQSPSPITDIYIYRNADGSSGMGNTSANSNMEIEQQLNKMREQMKERRKTAKNKDSMYSGMDAQMKAMLEQMEERKEMMKARMEERKLGGRAHMDSMRSTMMSRRDSMKTQMQERREEMMAARGEASKTDSNEKTGYIKLKDDTYYYVKKDNGSIAYYDRWGKEIKDDDEKYSELSKTLNTSKYNGNEDQLIKRLQKYSSVKSSQTEALYVINKKPATKEMVSALDPNLIDNVSVLKGRAATDLYGEDGKNGVIIVELKKGYNPSGGQKLIVTSSPNSDILNNQAYTKITITKNTTKNELNAFKDLFYAKGIDYKYYKLKRNSNDEIIRIEVSLQKGGNTSSSVFGNGETPISDVTVGYSNE